jgi:hemerythrin
METINNGSILIKQGRKVKQLYLLIYGIVEMIDSKNRIETTMSPGSIIGEIEGIDGAKVAVTYRAATYIRVLTIPQDLYRWFIKKYELGTEIKRISGNRDLLRTTWLFGEALPSAAQTKVAQAVGMVRWKKGTEVSHPSEHKLYLLLKGKGSLYSQKHTVIDTLEEGDFFCEDSVITGAPSMFSFRADTEVEAVVIPFDSFENIPIIQWKLFEIFERRIKIFKTYFHITWYDSYSVELEELDNQHKELFETLSQIFTIFEEQGLGPEYKKKLNQYFESLESHLAFEESLMTRLEYPRYLIQKNGHVSILTIISKYKETQKHSDSAELDFLEKMKEWLLVHTLIEDRKYSQFFREKGLR